MATITLPATPPVTQFEREVLETLRQLRDAVQAAR